MIILFISAYISDLIIGDPSFLPHPVRWMGKLIEFLDKRWNKNFGGFGKRESSEKAIDWFMRIKGIALTLVVISITTCLAYLFIKISKMIHPLLGVVAGIYVAYTTLATKDLCVKAKDILKELEIGRIVNARDKLSMIVGRDTQHLQQDEIIIATIESVAESINDGVIAPLFYLIIGGPLLAIAYRAINTLDSMVGYKNEKYIDFGWFSARLDDIANLIPARICGILIPLSSFLFGKGFLFPFKIMLRDHKNHASPNSGIPEAAIAGALKIRLGGNTWYDGKLYKKPFIGEARKEITLNMINQALVICIISSLQLIAIGTIIHLIVETQYIASL